MTSNPSISSRIFRKSDDENMIRAIIFDMAAWFPHIDVRSWQCSDVAPIDIRSLLAGRASVDPP